MTDSSRDTLEHFPWFREEMFRAIPHFISPAWNKDRSAFDPEHYADCWQRIGFKTVTLLTNHHDGYCLYPSELLRQQPDRDYFGEQVAACRKRDIRVLAYYSVSLNSLVGSEHPEWRVRDARDRVWVPKYPYFSHYHWLCLNSPYRDFVVGQLAEIASKYDVEGFFLDILYLPHWGIAHKEDREWDYCFCGHCHRAYSECYSGEHLIDALGTGRHAAFKIKTYAKFLQQVRDKMSTFDRPFLLTFNGAGTRPTFSEEMSKLADIQTTEAHNPLRRSFYGRAFRSAGKAFELISCSEVAWSHTSLQPTPLLKLELASTTAHGGTYTIGITHPPDGRLSEDNIERLAELGGWFREREDYFRNTEPVCDVALAGVFTGAQWLVRTDWVGILTKGHFLFAVLQELRDLDRYKAVIIPAGRGISAAERDVLEEYVAAGGNLLIESLTIPEHPAGPLFLEKLIGCVSLGKTDKPAPTFSGTAAPHALFIKPIHDGLMSNLFPNEPVLIECEQAELVETKTAEVIARLHEQFIPKTRTSDIQTVPNAPEVHSDKPGITLNHLGKGNVLFSTVPLSVPTKHEATSPYRQVLAQNCVGFLLDEKLVDITGYPRIEICANRKKTSYLLHFFNHSYSQGPYMNVSEGDEEYRDVFVSLSKDLRGKASRILLRPEGDELPVTEHEGRTGFFLPCLRVHALVEIETA